MLIHIKDGSFELDVAGAKRSAKELPMTHERSEARARAHERAVDVRIPPVGLEGIFERPDGPALGVILFAHGSGSGRFSPRNRFVAAALRKAGFATLLFDLLTEDEAANRANVFDIGLLAERLLDATRWAAKNPLASSLSPAYFGASTGAAAALVAAAELGDAVRAVVSRGGRPDLAGGSLARVQAPTLLIVGGDDREVITLNRAALRELRCEAKLEIVPGATHLFEEPGKLEAVVALAGNWFRSHLGAEA
jgi:putative phosphoribosyl transferase